MVLFNYSTRELTAKVVYYGPGLCGKTTNLHFIHANLPDNVKGKMLSLATKTDRTLFFDFLPLDLGDIRGMKTRVQLYTVPGQVFYNETRKLVLKGADGIVFVADSQEQMMGANIESFRNLEENLKAHGVKLAEVPHVIQYNKRDLPRLSGIEELNAAVNKYNVPYFESVATTGVGVQETLKGIARLVLLHLARKYDGKAASSVETPAVQPRPVSPVTEQPVARFSKGVGEPATPSRRPVPIPPADAGAARTGIPLSSMSAPPEPRPLPNLPPPPDFRRAAEPAALDEEMSPMSGPPEAQPSLGAVPEEEIAAAPAQPAATPPRPQVARFDGGTALNPPVAAGPADRGAGRPSYEVDVEFDPAWGREEPDPKAWPAATPRAASAPAPAVARESLAAAGAGETPIARPFRADDRISPAMTSVPAADAGGSVADDALLLSRVATESDLFDDSGLEIARLAEGEAREIVIPVELGEGAAARRFKLSLRLRLDPLTPRVS